MINFVLKIFAVCRLHHAHVIQVPTSSALQAVEAGQGPGTRVFTEVSGFCPFIVVLAYLVLTGLILVAIESSVEF